MALQLGSLKMRLLIVEDDLSYVKTVSLELKAEVSGLEVHISNSRESAFLELDNYEFDLILCDLKIPTVDGGLDEEIEHGLAVHGKARQVSQGTPIIFISAFGTVSITAKLIQQTNKEDVFGLGTGYQMIDFVEKAIDDCVTKVKYFANEMGILDEIEVSQGTANLSLTPSQKRILRIYARRLGGAIVHLTELGGGLSTARTLRVKVVDANGTNKALAVAKLNTLAKVEDEIKRFERHVAPMLGPGACSFISSKVLAGAYNTGGVFYQLAEGYDSSIYSVLATNSANAVSVIPKLKAIMVSWRDGLQKQTTIGKIRSALVSDEDVQRFAQELAGIDWSVFENSPVSVRECVRHRDLHGMNVLVSNSTSPLLIDYGEVGIACGSIDPLTLELGILFHPKGKELRGEWPNPAEARLWHDLEVYVARCPVKEFVKACREWAVYDAAGNKELYANAYAYAMRQLKYPDTDHGLAKAIISSAMEAFQMQ
jgi:CheY-like chemotaxis protein